MIELGKLEKLSFPGRMPTVILPMSHVWELCDLVRLILGLMNERKSGRSMEQVRHCLRAWALSLCCFARCSKLGKRAVDEQQWMSWLAARAEDMADSLHPWSLPPYRCYCVFLLDIDLMELIEKLNTKCDASGEDMQRLKLACLNDDVVAMREVMMKTPALVLDGTTLAGDMNVIEYAHHVRSVRIMRALRGTHIPCRAKFQTNSFLHQSV